jgi:primase-polymerase (primpol)-like protein
MTTTEFRLPFPDCVTHSEALAPLRGIPHWVAYKNVLRRATKKRPAHIDKLPVNPYTGELADTTNPATWSTYADTLAGLARWPMHGLGFVLTQALGLVVIDLDNAGDMVTGRIDPWARRILDDLATYAE